MNENEWGVLPGSQDNITPNEVPMLSELECDLVNLFRAFNVEKQRKIVQSLFSELMK